MINSIKNNLSTQASLILPNSDNLRLITKKTASVAVAILAGILAFPIGTACAAPALAITTKNKLANDYRSDMIKANAEIFKRSYVVRYPYRSNPEKAKKVFENYKLRMLALAKAKYAVKSIFKTLIIAPLGLIYFAGIISAHTCSKVYKKTFNKLMN
jgi:hypothetical protein